MRAISLFEELEFRSTESKKAYLKANKWIAQNIINEGITNVIWKIEKISNDPPIFKVSLYCEVDLIETFKSKCEACISFHNKFYINQQYNCDKCNAKALLKTVEEKLKIIKQYTKERLNT